MNAEQAFDLEARVRAARAFERRTWVPLAEGLAAFHHSKAWEALDYEKFGDWLGTPEVGLGRRQAYRLIQAWDWAGDNGVSQETLEMLDLTKLAVVIPAVKAGRAELQEALGDAEMLSRSDLVEKYTERREGAAQRSTDVPDDECRECHGALVSVCSVCGAIRDEAA